MLKNQENNGTAEIGFVTPTPELPFVLTVYGLIANANFLMNFLAVFLPLQNFILQIHD